MNFKQTRPCDWFEYLQLYGIYISLPWFRFPHMDLALRVLFHRFQIIFDRIRLTFSVATGTIKIKIKYITAVFTVNIPKPRRSCSWTYKINKLLVSPNERLNNIILERTIEYNTTQPQNSTQKNLTLPLRSRAHGKKDQSPHGPLTCSHVSHKLSRVSVTVYAVTCPCKN